MTSVRSFYKLILFCLIPLLAVSGFVMRPGKRGENTREINFILATLMETERFKNSSKPALKRERAANVYRTRYQFRQRFVKKQSQQIRKEETAEEQKRKKPSEQLYSIRRMLDA